MVLAGDFVRFIAVAKITNQYTSQSGTLLISTGDIIYLYQRQRAENLLIAFTALATLSLAKLKIMQGDKFIIASLLCIILLIFFFIVYPTLAIFVSMFYDGETFAPQQVMRILTQSYIVRVISNSLFLSGFVGIVSTVFGLAFALYTTRIARRTAFIGKIFSILPIVTPPFVVGLGVTLMLGRSGYVTEFLSTNFGFTNHTGYTVLTVSPLHKFWHLRQFPSWF